MDRIELMVDEAQRGMDILESIENSVLKRMVTTYVDITNPEIIVCESIDEFLSRTVKSKKLIPVSDKSMVEISNSTIAKSNNFIQGQYYQMWDKGIENDYFESNVNAHISFIPHTEEDDKIFFALINQVYSENTTIENMAKILYIYDGR